MHIVVPALPLDTLPKNCWPKVLGSVVIQLYADECTPSVDQAEIVISHK